MQYVWMFEVLKDMRSFARQHGFREVDAKLEEVIDTAGDEIPRKMIAELECLAENQHWDEFRSSLDRLLIAHGLDKEQGISSAELEWIIDQVDSMLRSASHG